MTTDDRAGPIPPDRPGRRIRASHVIGATLVAFGLSGLVLFGALGVSLFRAPSTVDVQAVVDRLDATLANAAETAISADRALASTAASAARVSQMLQELSTSLHAGADALRIEILGSRPFVDVADSFATTADRAADAAREVDGTRAGIDATRDSITASAVNIDALRVQVARLVDVVDEATGRLRPLALVALWFAALSVAMVAVGLWLWVGRRPTS